MKKVMMMAIALIASASAFAGDSPALKEIMKLKDYAEANKLVQSSLSQLANDAEKAKAYNKLVDLAMAKVSQETGTIAANQMAVQMGTGKVQPYDTLGLADAIMYAIDAASECNKFDQLPDEKGRTKPKYDKKNAERTWVVRSHLLNIGNEMAGSNNNAAVLKYWGAWIDSHQNPFFAEQNHQADLENLGQVAYWCGRFAFEAQDMPRAMRYFEIAKKDEKHKKDAENYQLFALRSSAKTHQDSLNVVNQLKELYAKTPDNEVIVDAINMMYEGLDKKAQIEFLDQHLTKFPTSFTALANKGLIAMNNNNAEEGAEWLRKAAQANPDNAVVFTYLGVCLNAQASMAEDAAKRNSLFDQAIEAFEKAKSLDPEKRIANWGYNRYQAFYGRYGENDPKTKAAEADR
jgi:tetratricopeptide (TPR) repeat protein